jgi:hypothetical protein
MGEGSRAIERKHPLYLESAAVVFLYLESAAVVFWRWRTQAGDRNPFGLEDRG